MTNKNVVRAILNDLQLSDEQYLLKMEEQMLRDKVKTWSEEAIQCTACGEFECREPHYEYIRQMELEIMGDMLASGQVEDQRQSTLHVQLEETCQELRLPQPTMTEQEKAQYLKSQRCGDCGYCADCRSEMPLTPAQDDSEYWEDAMAQDVPAQDDSEHIMDAAWLFNYAPTRVSYDWLVGYLEHQITDEYNYASDFRSKCRLALRTLQLEGYKMYMDVCRHLQIGYIASEGDVMWGMDEADSCVFTPVKKARTVIPVQDSRGPKCYCGLLEYCEEGSTC
jgi:hypothetical protein